MKEVVLTYVNAHWKATAAPPVTLADEIILFRNNSDRPCQISFEKHEAFGILGICIPAQTGFALVFRGVATIFQMADAPIVDVRDLEGNVNPTIPPGDSN